MVVGTATQGPSEFAIAFGYRVVIDAGDPTAHQTVFVEFPILIAVSAEPIAAVVVILVGEANGDAISAKRPEFLDQSILELPVPFPGQEGLDLSPSIEKLGAVSPCAVRRCTQGRPWRDHDRSTHPRPCEPFA